MRRVAALLFLASLYAGRAPAAVPGIDDELASAEKLLEQKNFAGAETILREIVRSDPSNARAHGNLALALLSQGKVREAVDEGRLAAAMGPDLPEARYIYGLALRAEGRPLEAAREFEKATRLKPGQASPLRALARAYAAAEDPRVVATYDRLIALEPLNAANRSELAEYLWQRDRAEEGNGVMEAALQALPDDSDLAVNYGRALFDQGLYIDAARRLEVATARGAKGTATAVLLGNAYWQVGKTDAALVVFETAARSLPPDSQLQWDLGRLLLSVGRPEAALPHLQETVRLQPDTGEARLDLGRAYETLGRLADAEESYRMGVKLSPKSPRAHYVLGLLLVRQEKKEEGERELGIHRALYERARQLFSEAKAKDGEAALAWAQLIQGKTTAALARFAALPESPDSLLGRATALSRLSRHREAVLALERAHELDPENHRVQALLATERSRAEEKK